ncbi:MAG: acyltransferase [Pseudomonadota bacterium]
MPNLQILRFLAAFLVLVSHVQHEAMKGTFLNMAGYQPWEFIYFAGGVDIFFVISGFIMYAIASGDFGQQGKARSFFLRRLVRIVPPYWLFTTAMVGAALVFRSHVTHSALALDHILASYFFLPYLNPYGEAYPVLMLGWTLNYEFFFYMIFGLALLFPKKIGLALIFGVIGLCGALGAAQLVQRQPFLFWSNPIVFEFLFGIGLAMLRERGVRCGGAAGWGMIALGFAAMWLLKGAGIAGDFWVIRPLWMGLPALLICAGVVLVREPAAAIAAGPGPLKRQLVLLGDASYAIYLSHPFALNAVALLWKRIGLHDPWVYVAVACVVSLVVGVLVHLLIEKPMTRYLNTRLNMRLARPGGPVSRPA